MRLLAADPNKKGDLFGRLVRDVFHTLGYADSSLTIHKGGREIDIAARHRLEPKRAIGECKATARPIGSADLNKFAGVLQLEVDDLRGEDIQGYFVSLSGFTETALAQESDLDHPRFVLLSGAHVENQLVQGGAVVSPEVARDSAGRLASKHVELVPEGPVRLLAHDLGWIWLCSYGSNHETTHFALIHADGRPLSGGLAQEVIAADGEIGGNLDRLCYLKPQNQVPRVRGSEVDRRYREYLLSELDQITLEGLPIDEEAGARRIALGDLYVPLRLKPSPTQVRAGKAPSAAEADVSDEEDGNEDDGEEGRAESVGEVLGREHRLAILAPPGTGKSTLIKRLAVAYAEKDHRGHVKDGLPSVDWLPLFIRCRSLGGIAREPIRRILGEIPERGEFPEYKDAFEDLVTSALRHGKVLLLIDGLDEIAESTARVAFALQLRTFLSTYPNVAVVITSREAGFRIVGGAMSPICSWYQLDEFSNEDIVSLTKGWHATVVGRSDQVEREAGALASTIVTTDRVRRLARNPLLLTTLLLVKRWVGDLPRKRAILYEKAIEVLLMTWNVEAHEPIESEEAIPQLAFVAHTLTEEGAQSVNATELAKLLKAARTQMPEVLGYARISISDFIERIETRSSLLVMTGHEEEGGKLVPVYEFRHLTFQEYLTAVALVEGYHSGDSSHGLTETLESHFDDPSWFEVIALANVLAGRSANLMISRLQEVSEMETVEPLDSVEQPTVLLGRSLADEVQLSPELIKAISRRLGETRRRSMLDHGLTAEILEGRYGRVFAETVEQAYLSGGADFPRFSRVYARIVDSFYDQKRLGDEGAIHRTSGALMGDDPLAATRAALWIMLVVFESRSSLRHRKDHVWELLNRWSQELIRWLELGPPHVQYSASWALSWLGEAGAVLSEDRVRGLNALLGLWRAGSSDATQRMAAWAFSEMPRVSPDLRPFGEEKAELTAFAEEQVRIAPAGETTREDRRPAARVLTDYLGAPRSDQGIRSNGEDVDHPSTPRVMPTFDHTVSDAGREPDTS